jgi:hypothetical protein
MATQMRIAQAAEYLGVSRTKVWKLVVEGTLSARSNPLDKREKLAPAAELERLREAGSRVAAARREPRSRSDGFANNPDSPPSDELESDLASTSSSTATLVFRWVSPTEK